MLTVNIKLLGVVVIGPALYSENNEVLPLLLANSGSVS
jgi:hypothetical protein